MKSKPVRSRLKSYEARRARFPLAGEDFVGFGKLSALPESSQT